MIKYYFSFLFIMMFWVQAQSQVTRTPTNEVQDTSSGEKIKVVYADLQRSIKMASDFERYLEGNVQIIKDSSFFYCDTARLNDFFLKAWGDVSMLKSDSMEIFADSLVYDIEKEEADIYGSVYFKSKDQILFSDYIHFDDKYDIAYYTDKAILRDKTVELKSKRGEFRTQEDLALFSQQVSVFDSAFQLFADTLLYNTALNKAIFRGPTDILMDSATVYCEAGYFLMDTEYGVFRKNAKYTGTEDTATARIIRADGIRNTVELIGDAVYKGKTAYAKGDSIKYNKETGEVRVMGNGYVLDGDQELRSDVIFYNEKTKKFSSKGRSIIISETNNLEADNIEALDKVGLATGKVIFQDTSNGFRIDSEFLEFDQGDASQNKAYGNPGETALMRISMDKSDSLFISADTLFSFKVFNSDTTKLISYDTTSISIKDFVYDYTIDTIKTVDSDSTFITSYDTTSTKVVDTLLSYAIDTITTITDIQNDTTDFLTAYYGVKIYSDEFQAVCDSLAFNTKDSILTLYRNPIMWSDTSQFKGDTIVMYFRDGGLKKLDLFPNSFIINSPDEIFFNQIKGKITQAYFTDGKIDSMEVDGNAETVYYIQDDNKAYIGVNKTVCSAMTFYFKEELDHIDFETQPTSNMHPMAKVNHEELKLEGYSWDINKRPKEKKAISPVLAAEKKSLVPEKEQLE